MKTQPRLMFVGLMLSLSITLTSCKSDPPATESNLTAGMAKKTIVPRQTRQLEVMEVFGPPDLVTRSEAGEVWTYDKIRHDVRSSGGYLTVLFAGVGGASARSSSTSTMLIIHFDSADVVKDYRMSVTRF